jgi:hypothetical protein
MSSTKENPSSNQELDRSISLFYSGLLSWEEVSRLSLLVSRARHEAIAARARLEKPSILWTDRIGKYRELSLNQLCVVIEQYDGILDEITRQSRISSISQSRKEKKEVRRDPKTLSDKVNNGWRFLIENYDNIKDLLNDILNQFS